jgi:hypothetical protein
MFRLDGRAHHSISQSAFAWPAQMETATYLIEGKLSHSGEQNRHRDV